MTDDKIKTDMISAREQYIGMIKTELLGPGSEFSIPDAEHELISVSPTSRYYVGVLFPQGVAVEQDNDETMQQSDDDLEDEDGASATESQAEDEGEAAGERSDSYVEGDDADDVNFVTDEENLDDEISMSSQYKPSSMGVTFLAKGDVERVHVRLSFATYRKAKISECKVPYSPEMHRSAPVPEALSDIVEFVPETGLLTLKREVKYAEVREFFENDDKDKPSPLKGRIYRLAKYCSSGYVREPHKVDDVILDFSGGDYVDNESTQKLDGTKAKLVAIRHRVSDDTASVTVMLVNGNKKSSMGSASCIFQPKLEIYTEDNGFVFAESSVGADVNEMDAEELSLNLLYRHKKTYATGLGTSVDWKIDGDGRGRLWTDFFPEREIPRVSCFLPENDKIKESELSMKYLSDLDGTAKDEKLSSMRKLVDLYKQWVEGLEQTAKDLDPQYKSAASKNIGECKEAYKRMYAGIDTLAHNDNAYNAFMLANRAMFMQRIHIAKQAEMAAENADRYPNDGDIQEWLEGLDYYTESDGKCRWYPFQIAFLLMDVNSIVNEKSSERKLVDLIWFPTGGGKTEAYLGLTTFTIFYRKLTYPKASAGTAVIMRYTLRLLAAQQFTRASTLICACEYIRQYSNLKTSKYPAYQLGDEPITIGLWIGGEHTPNTNDKAREHLGYLTRAEWDSVKYAKDQHNKFQVLKCPWCGTKMVMDAKDKQLVGSWGYGMDGQRRNRHFYLRCTHDGCHFRVKLPIQVVDEELYKSPPTLLFGTVDKFAMLPWNGDTGAFFGLHGNNRPPELIIQDELHLISGALGTIVGLFETAVEALCMEKGVSPKIIASTATIRRAREQCSVLYNREVVQFPAPGLDAEDSFFAKESVIDHERGRFGRKYVGIMPSGKTKSNTEIKAIAALLQKAYIAGFPEKVKDKLWTLTAYFNSLRDLGQASSFVSDSVSQSIAGNASRMFTYRRFIRRIDELTSRVKTTALNESLDRLERLEYSEANIAAKRYASDVLLATNMISVGIDIARLNVMLMVGQPKLTSEYIQASSRVGRSYPGVVFVQYDASRSRDRSHYERFRSYHDSFYRFVEPTGATPFSKPARERALHSVLVAILRNKAGLNRDDDAINFDREKFKDWIKEAEEFVIARVEGINRRAENQAPDDVEEIRSEMEEFFDKWQRYAQECNAPGKEQNLLFGKRYMNGAPGEGNRRLLRPYNSGATDAAVDTLTSMRNVDISVRGDAIVKWEDNNAN